jgi:hypothetical protein
MAFDDLNLEFEDEDEAKKKKGNDAVQVDVVDLEFQSPGSDVKPRPAAPRPVGAAAAPGAAPRPPGEVRKLDEARTTPPAKRPPAPTQAPPAPRPVPVANAGSAAPKFEDLNDFISEPLVETTTARSDVEFNAAVSVAAAEFKIEILSDVLGDMRLLEHQVGQLLARMNAKHPDLKQEALTIKKLLADFTAKKRK